MYLRLLWMYVGLFAVYYMGCVGVYFGLFRGGLGLFRLYLGLFSVFRLYLVFRSGLPVNMVTVSIHSSVHLFNMMVICSTSTLNDCLVHAVNDESCVFVCEENLYRSDCK